MQKGGEESEGPAGGSAPAQNQERVQFAVCLHVKQPKQRWDTLLPPQADQCNTVTETLMCVFCADMCMSDDSSLSDVVALDEGELKLYSKKHNLTKHLVKKKKSYELNIVGDFGAKLLISFSWDSFSLTVSVFSNTYLMLK